MIQTRKKIIGTIGADFLDQKACEIDFPSFEIRLHASWPANLSLDSFTPFKFKGRRIMLPATMDGVEMELFYDSGCSAFGFLAKNLLTKLRNDSIGDSWDHSVKPNENAPAKGQDDFVPTFLDRSNRS